MEYQKSGYLISYRTLRLLIGVLGILLPFICWGVNAFVNQLNLLNNPFFIDESQSTAYYAGSNIKSSVSFYFYTTAGPLFTGILITVSIFLFAYTGHPRDDANDRFPWLTDKAVTSFAACSALGIVAFPTNSVEIITDNIYRYVASEQVGKLHIAFSTLFFLSMALISIVNFRRQPQRGLLTDTKGKLYLICGWGIIVCIMLLVAYMIAPNGSKWLFGKFVFLIESVMLIFFGIAWVVKGKSVPSQFIIERLVTRRKR